MDLATVIRQGLDLWGNPPYTELSAEAILDAGNRVLSQHNLDMDLTPDACFHTDYSEAFTFDSADSRDKLLDIDAIDDISRILRVESRNTNSTSEDDWQKETTASFENWQDILERSDADYVCFYTTEDGLTMRVGRDVSSLEFRIAYKVLQAKIAAPSQVLALPALYESLLVYDLALEFSQLIDNRSPEFTALKSSKMAFLEGRRADAYNRVERWRRSQRGAGPVKRRAFNDRGIDSDFFGRRRLF